MQRAGVYARGLNLVKILNETTGHGVNPLLSDVSNAARQLSAEVRVDNFVNPGINEVIHPGLDARSVV